MGTPEDPLLIRIDTPEPWEFAIPEGTTRIGRSRESHICLEDSAVSRFHCYLLREGNVVRIFDGESKNPARVNGEVVTGQRLKDGNAIRVGRCEFVYQAVKAAPPARPAPPLGGSARQTARFVPPARPRARQRTRSREPSPVAILIAVAAAGGALWFFLGILPGLGTRPREPGEQAARVDPVRLDLERRLSVLQNAQEAYRKETASAATVRKMEEMNEQIAALSADLARLRAREKGAPGPPPPAPDAKSAVQAGTLDHPAIGLPHPEGTPVRDPEESRTVVVATGPRLTRRPEKEVRDCVDRLRKLLDDYATHTILPATLEPDLTLLAFTEGRAAGEGLQDVDEHARRLLKITDASIAENARRKEVLLAKARAMAPAYGEGPAAAAKAKDGYGYGKKASADLELAQRELELHDTAAGIHGQHREFLLALRQAILAAIARVADPAALGPLRARLAAEEDEEFALAVARAAAATGSRESMPALWKKLAAARSAPLKEGIRKALAALAGVDLGDQAGPWAEWWEKNKPPGSLK